LIQNDKLKWLTPDGVIHDTFPRPSRAVCGTGYSKNTIIRKSKSHFIEYEIDQFTNAKADSIILGSLTEFKVIKYLNNSDSIYYHSLHDLYKEFKNNIDYYYYAKENESGVFELINVQDSIRRAIRRKNYHLRGEQRDSLDRLIKLIPKQHRIKYIKRLENSQLKLCGYHHPIRIEKDGAVRYYPIHNKPIYKELEMFNMNFAKYVKFSGEKGWIDLTGNEYKLE